VFVFGAGPQLDLPLLVWLCMDRKLGNGYRRLFPGLALMLLVFLWASAGAGADGLLSWGSPRVIDGQRPFVSQPSVNQVACPRPRLCVALESQGVVVSADPAAGSIAWRATSFLGLSGYSGQPLSVLACSTQSFCAAGSESGDLLVNRNLADPRSKWSVSRFARGVQHLTCPSAHLCVGIGSPHSGPDGNAYRIYSSVDPAGGTRRWRSFLPRGLLDPSGLQGVACPSVRMCAVIAERDTNRGDTEYDYGLDLLTSTSPAGGPRAWRNQRPAFSAEYDDGHYGGLTCPTPRWCAVTGMSLAGSHSRDSILAVSRPTARHPAFSVGQAPEVSDEPLTCPTKRLCLVAQGGGGLLISRDPLGGQQKWRTIVVPNLAGLNLACGSARLCVDEGKGASVEVVTQPASRRAWHRIDLGQGANPLSSVSCPSISLCVAADADGSLVSSTDAASGSWTLRQVLRRPRYDGYFPGYSIGHVACPAITFCAATAGVGLLTSQTPSTGPWIYRALTRQDVGSQSALACLTSALCLVADESGRIVISPQGAGQVAAVQIGAPPSEVYKGDYIYDNITGIACPTQAFCAATDGDSLWVTETPAAAAPWRLIPTPPDGQGNALTCLAPTTCVEVNASGAAVSTDVTDPHPTWSTAKLPKLTLTVPPGFQGGPTYTGSPKTLAVSCASATRCVAVDSVGGYAFDGDPGSGTWSANKITSGQSNSEAPSALTSVSCPTPTLCLAVDGTGHAIIGRYSS